NLFGIIASVLHLGNIQFEEDSNGHAIITNGTQIKWISKLLGVHLSILQEALTNRKIEARFEEVLSPLNVDLAYYARDAVAKAIYGRMFTWLVNKINGSLANKDDPTRKTVIGLLDIYGFEVFETNSFEQFCINYCNEKLQQLLIEMTLKAEQEEYKLEGIEDEECLRPGEATDLSFLEKLEEKVGHHAHFLTRKLAKQKNRKSIGWVDFRLLHYAGEVTYCAVGFLEKNNDLLYRNLKEVLCKSKNGIVRECFHLSELDSRRRPETVATQFKNSLVSLIEILMSKEPSYIRCIKPNDNKEPDKFDDSLIRHQVKYLGLMEHLRVRRAGFAYRRKYEHFLQRYKSLCPDTWPHWRGSAARGVEKLVKHLGYKPDEYKMGKTKIFIRFPRTLFATEDAFEYRKHMLISRVQAKYKGCLGRREYQKKRQAAIKLEARWRGVLARKEAERRAWAAQTIRKYIRGFINRKQPPNPENEDYVKLTRYTYIMKLRDHLPKTVLDQTWLQPPALLQETSEHLKKLCRRTLVRKYCRSITAERKAQMQQKRVASDIFRGKKEGYADSVPEPFAETRMKEDDLHPKVLQLIRHEKIKYVAPVVKFEQKNFKPRDRLLVLTRVSSYLVEATKIKEKVEYNMIKGLSVSGLSDGILVVHVAEECKHQKGDIILQCEKLFETAIKLCLAASKEDIAIAQGSLIYSLGGGKESSIVFTTAHESRIYKAKSGLLTVPQATDPAGGPYRVCRPLANFRGSNQKHLGDFLQWFLGVEVEVTLRTAEAFCRGPIENVLQWQGRRGGAFLPVLALMREL
ncbi:UNVERIFIED_CONTAM: Unconventional myosin-Ih, partial [Gekko kuhli]